MIHRVYWGLWGATLALFFTEGSRTQKDSMRLPLGYCLRSWPWLLAPSRLARGPWLLDHGLVAHGSLPLDPLGLGPWHKDNKAEVRSPFCACPLALAPWSWLVARPWPKHLVLALAPSPWLQLSAQATGASGSYWCLRLTPTPTTCSERRLLKLAPAIRASY